MLEGVKARIELRKTAGCSVYSIAGTEWNLARRNGNSFEPVDRIERDVGLLELDKQYGVWSGNRGTRPAADGTLPAGTVMDFLQFRRSQTSHLPKWRVGADECYTFDGATLHASDPGGAKTPTLETQWTLHHGDWNQAWLFVSPLSPPTAHLPASMVGRAWAHARRYLAI